MSSKLCFFRDIVRGGCGASRGLETLFRLRDCNDDIGGHLVNCHLSSECLTEKELILARAGLFSVTEIADRDNVYLSKTYRHSLGKFWRPPRSCQYPDHKGKSIAVGGRHVIGLKLAKEIHGLFGENAAVGSRKYKMPFYYYGCSLKRG